MKRLLPLALITSLLLLSAMLLAKPAKSDDSAKARTVYVKLGKVDRAKGLKAVKALGSIVGGDPNGTLTVLVKSPAAADKAVIALRHVRSVSLVWSAERPLLPQQLLESVPVIKQKLKAFPNDEDDHKGGDHKVVKHIAAKKESDNEPDYLRALLYYTDRRAYPYDRIDWDAYRNAVDHASKMTQVTAPSTTPDGIRTAAQVKTPVPVPAASSKWSYIGPNNLDVPYQIYYGTRPTSGRLGAIAYDPQTTTTYYIGGSAGGLWKTTDSGVTWKALGDMWPALPVSSIAVDPKTPSTIYVGTGDYQGGVGLTNGIMKSTNGGTTWTALGVAEFGQSDVSQIIVDPETPSTITATTCYGPSGSGEVWRSTNGGASWSPVIAIQSQWTSATASIISGGTRTYYAASGGNPGLIYSSSDRGATWAKITSPITASVGAVIIAASAVDASTVYAFAPEAQQIFKSTNKGSSWTNITGDLVTGSSYNFSQSFYDFFLGVTNNAGSDDLFIGLIDVAESTNGGTNWTFIGQSFQGDAKTHNDQHCFAANPSNPNEILYGNDGGMYRGTRSGTSWTMTGLSKNLGVTMFYHGIFDPTDPTKMIGGTQDNATPVSTGDLANWSNVGGGDGGFVAVNPANRMVQYCTIYDLTVIQTTNGWQSQNDISPNTSGDGNLPFVTPVYNDPVNTQYMYALSDYVYRWDNNAGTWTNRLGNQQLSNGGLIHALAVAPSNGNIIYTGSDDGQLYMSKNGGTSWTNITAGLPNRSIQAISVDRTNPYSILIGLSGSGTAHLYQCANTNVGSPSYVSVSGGTGLTGLPDASLNCIERDLTAQSQRWYVGTDIGVFITFNSGKTWSNATNSLGLPIVQINAIQETLYGTLNVATYGRGMWKLPLTALNAPTGLVPYAVSIYEGAFVPSAPTPVNGQIAQLAKTDGVFVTTGSTYYSSAQEELGGFEADFRAGSGTLQGLSLTMASSVSSPSTVQLFVWNNTTGKFDLLSQAPGTVSVGTTTYTVTNNIASYMDATGKIRVIVRSVNPGRQGAASVLLKVDSLLATATTSGASSSSGN